MKIGIYQHYKGNLYRLLCIACHTAWRLDISKDLMVYTKEEFEAKLIDQTSFIYKIANNGKLLFNNSGRKL